MFVILYYDVKSERCNKMLKTCHKYLKWVQKSVFEGEISESSYRKLEKEILNIIKKEEGDSVIVYRFKMLYYSDRKVYGEEKSDDIMFL